MNTLQAITVTSPFNKTEECSCFTIDDVASPFLMNNIATVGQNYTLSFWIYSETAGTVTVAGTTYDTTTAWTKHTHKFTADNTSLSWRFGSTGTYYIYHPQLETGNQVTDWRPNPEDVEQSIVDATDDVREEITEQSTSIISSTSEMILSALESRVKIDDYDAFKQTVEAQLKVMADEILMSFTTATEQIKDVDESQQSKFTELYKHISFSTDGITISAGENAMSIRIDNDILMFEKNGVMFGWWDGVNFNTGNIMVNVNERAQFGNYAFVPRTDGSLSFLKVTHNTGFYAVLGGGVLSIYGAYPTLSDSTLNITDINAELSETTLILGG